MEPIQAVYEGGVFRPVTPVQLPDHCLVEFEPRVVPDNSAQEAAQAAIQAILSRRYNSGDSEVAARHDEHQPEISHSFSREPTLKL